MVARGICIDNSESFVGRNRLANRSSVGDMKRPATSTRLPWGLAMMHAGVSAAVFALSACSSSPHSAAVATHHPDSLGRCIRVEDLSEWQPLDDRSILLSAPGNPRSHLLTLAAPIDDLVLAGDIEIVDGDLNGLICADGVDEIFVEECSCSSAKISSIDYLSEKRTAELLAGSAVTL
jgi:hypothetical protein